jgi:hypothetical protein
MSSDEDERAESFIEQLFAPSKQAVVDPFNNCLFIGRSQPPVE